MPTDYVFFGQYLRSQRELRGMSLDQVAQTTKIPLTLIDALEEGQAERFPERVFVMNYIRSYASAVGLSADDAVNRFQEIPGSPKPDAFDPAALEVVRRERAVSAMWVTIASTLVLVMALAFQAMHELVLRFANR